MDINQEKKNTAPEKMEIEISRYKTLIEAMGDQKRVVRLIIILTVVIAVIAIGIIGIVYGIKRFYPYKSINSNTYGATFIKDEDNEIIYWLFNTADLWANSGIEVKEGDVISVRTSGAFNPAIHHLVEDAESNNALRDPWVLSGGQGRLEYGQLYNQEAAREKFRIADYAPFSAILMQVIPNKIEKKDRGWIRDTTNAPYVDGHENSDIIPDIYVIGEGKESIRIRTSGVLHFAVNDVPLTHSNIIRMEDEEKHHGIIEFKDVKGVWYFIPSKSFDSIFNYKKINEKIEFTNKWFVYDSTREKRVGERIISTEFWNRDYLRQIEMMDASLRFGSEYLDKKYKKLIKKNQELLKVCADSTIRYLNRIKDNEMTQELLNSYADCTIMYLGYLKDKEFTKVYADSAIKYLEYINSQEIPETYADSTKTYAVRTIKYLDCLKDNEKVQGLPKAYDTATMKKYLKYLSSLKLIDTNWWMPKENEYYKDRRFVDAWFVDNVGSFMIVIERKTDK